MTTTHDSGPKVLSFREEVERLRGVIFEQEKAIDALKAANEKLAAELKEMRGDDLDIPDHQALLIAFTRLSEWHRPRYLAVQATTGDGRMITFTDRQGQGK